MLSADQMGGGLGSTGLAPRQPVSVAVTEHPSDVGSGPWKRQASPASEPAIALLGLEKREYRMVTEIKFRLCLGAACAHHLTPAKNRYARRKVRMRVSARQS